MVVCLAPLYICLFKALLWKSPVFPLCLASAVLMFLQPQPLGGLSVYSCDITTLLKSWQLVRGTFSDLGCVHFKLDWAVWYFNYQWHQDLLFNKWIKNLTFNNIERLNQVDLVYLLLHYNFGSILTALPEKRTGQLWPTWESRSTTHQTRLEVTSYQHVKSCLEQDFKH